MLESEYLDCPFKLMMTVEPMHLLGFEWASDGNPGSDQLSKPLKAVQQQSRGFGIYFITMFMWQHVDGQMLKAKWDHGPKAVLNIGPEQAFMHIEARAKSIQLFH